MAFRSVCRSVRSNATSATRKSAQLALPSGQPLLLTKSRMSSAILNAPGWSPPRKSAVPMRYRLITPQGSGRPGVRWADTASPASNSRMASACTPLEHEHLAEREVGVAEAGQPGGRSGRGALSEGVQEGDRPSECRLSLPVAPLGQIGVANVDRLCGRVRLRGCVRRRRQAGRQELAARRLRGVAEELRPAAKPPAVVPLRPPLAVPVRPDQRFVERTGSDIDDPRRDHRG